MTKEEAIARIRDHMVVHKMNEPRAIYISEALDMAIKALEAFEIPPNDNWDGYSSRLWKAAYERGKADAEQRWIPTSERLPEEAYCCIVTVMDTNPMTYDDFENIYPDFVGYDGETWNDEDGEPIPFEVIAWMPLPLPWKGE